MPSCEGQIFLKRWLLPAAALLGYLYWAMKKTLPRLVPPVLWLVVLALMAGCAPSARQIKPARPAEPYTGPRARLVVAPFKSKAANASNRLAEGLADMVTSALFAADRFILLDREALDEAAREQKLLEEQARLLGAELILTGEITAFSPDHLGAGGFILGLVTLGGSVYARTQMKDFPLIAASYLEAELALELKILDAATGRVVAQGAVEAESYDFGGGVLIYIRDLDIPVVLGGFSGTATERVLRLAVNEVVAFMVEKAPAEYLRHRDGPPGRSLLVQARPIEIKRLRPKIGRRRAAVIDNEADFLAEIRAVDPTYPGRPPAIDFGRESVLVVTSETGRGGCRVGLEKVVDRGERLEAIIGRSCLKPKELTPAWPGQDQASAANRPAPEKMITARFYAIPKPNKEVIVTWRD